MIKRIYHTIKFILDSSNLEDNFSLIHTVKNTVNNKLTSRDSIVAFPGPYWFFPPMLPELCTICF